MMNWTKALALLLAVAVLAAPASALAAASPSNGNLMADYAAREAQAGDLEQFTGGWHGVVLTVAVAALVIWLFLELFDHDGHVERTPHHHDAHPVHP
jgi:hypothetical protein